MLGNNAEAETEGVSLFLSKMCNHCDHYLLVWNKLAALKLNAKTNFHFGCFNRRTHQYDFQTRKDLIWKVLTNIDNEFGHKKLQICLTVFLLFGWYSTGDISNDIQLEIFSRELQMCLTVSLFCCIGVPGFSLSLFLSHCFSLSVFCRYSTGDNRRTRELQMWLFSSQKSVF